ncbi:MAG: GTPase HflX, partial [Chloroflexaceae bacterium]|nr:GTPase HflX [Chloroflexaceae bacterium]
DSLQELALLATTAGLDVVAQVSQTLNHPSPKYFIGPGKVREILSLCQEHDVDLVIFDDELTPAQTRNLEKELDLGVLDRTALILDIFAQHAHTHEGRLQVELAQYHYLLPRLRRQWTHLERQTGQGGTSAGGVVGLRGPGETQLEVDRRLINRRIAWLNEQLRDVHRHREMYRQRRRTNGQPIIALVGYTNAGKSTLMNALTNAGVYVEDQLFATLDPTTRQIELPGGQHAMLTDTVGFIQKLPTQLIAAFRATLEEMGEADVLLHLIDITHPNAAEHARTVMATLAELNLAQKPVLHVFNKIDALPTAASIDIDAYQARLNLPDPCIAISAQQQQGLTQLLSEIAHLVTQTMVWLDASIPYARNDLLALWHERGLIEEQVFEADATRVTGRIPGALVSRFAGFIKATHINGMVSQQNGEELSQHED